MEMNSCWYTPIQFVEDKLKSVLQPIVWEVAYI